MQDQPQQNRRDFLKLGALAGTATLGTLATGCFSGDRVVITTMTERDPLRTPAMKTVRIGFVGVGGMGTNHVNQLCKVPGAEIVAVCDVVPEHAKRAQDIVEKAGFKRPAAFDKGPEDYRRLCETVDCDVVYTATPWELHVPVCVAAMNAGKHAVTEVPAAYRIEDCWKLVELAEKHSRHCIMLENCCYDRVEMLFLNIIRKGLLGEVLHGECGYLHDLRGVKFSKDGEGLWRRAHATRRNGNLYPTHGIGPVANYMNINRGDQFDYLVSMSGPSRGLQLFQQDKLEKDDPRRAEQYVLGDVNLALIKTKLGKTIYLVHDTNLPRPYSRINLVQGTRGLMKDYPPEIHIEGRSPGHGWQKAEEYYAEFEHPLWRSDKVKQASGGHGGMDYLENYRLIQCLLKGEPTDMNVYDAAAWSCLCEATERSVAGRSKSVDIPDFTRGRWKSWQPLPIVEA
ncbi:MAG: Gfo/Idh/MocA family oxidoreductase [Planctomycetes bacterium]|nr:Gfo/Idh/MocA family oxidoreductase [Planctomycetota bacterium]